MTHFKSFFHKIIQFIVSFLNKGHQRTILAKQNIVGSFLIKAISIAINLAMIPITIHYVSPVKYGIWITLSSIIAWISFFDIGFGNGLRNKLAEAKANGDINKAKIYISTTYAVLSLIFFCIWVIFIFLNYFLDWNKILNTSQELGNELSLLAIIVFSSFCLQIIFKIINIILLADQKPAKAALLDTLGQFTTLILIFILTKTTHGSLIYLGVALGFAPICIYLFSTIWFFKKQYRVFAPSLQHVHFKFAKDIMNLGIKFFIIQIAIIVIHQTSNIIIAQVRGPEEVTTFNIAYKYIGIVLMVFAILTAPFWSSFTEAYVEKDYSWMITTVKKLRRINYLLVVIILFFLLISKQVYKLWLNDAVIIPFTLSAAISVFVIILSLITLNTNILNGFGKIKLQLITYSIGTILHIPFALFLGGKFGTIGVIISASSFCLIIAIFSIIQVNKLVQNNAHGIWNE